MTTVTLVRKSAYHNSVPLPALARGLRARTRDRGGRADKTSWRQALRDPRRGPKLNGDWERDQGPESGSAARTEAKGAVQPTMPPCARTISSVASLKAAK